MTHPQTLSPDLERLGEALRAAATDDLGARGPARQEGRKSRRRRAALIGLGLAIVLPGGALAATSLLSGDDVARSIPAGTLSLLNSDPTCAAVRANVEYDCTLAHPPHGELAADGWKSTVEPTVDASKHVNGGCRSLSADGTHWRCYIGQEAVREQIIGPDLLGAFAPSPGVG